MAVPFATYSDLEGFWRPLSSAEQGRASTLLRYASAHIRNAAKGIDARIDSGDLDEDIPRMVACSMVKRVMQGPSDLEGVSQKQDTAGPFQSGVTFANPSGNLYLGKDDRRMLGIGVQRAFTIDLLTESSSSGS